MLLFEVRTRGGAVRSHSEVVAYLSVAVALVVTGVFLRTVVLNWLVGPISVVIGVVLISRVVERRGSTR
jgi:hypothetical protein